MNKKDQADAYRKLMGNEAADRQEELAVRLCSVCGWWVAKLGHDPRCPKRKT